MGGSLLLDAQKLYLELCHVLCQLGSRLDSVDSVKAMFSKQFQAKCGFAKVRWEKA